ncbi:MAG: hypothetical protein DMD81_01885 [Candidatus Rokuibacteriota bacterium]|nr:MAG: hypothetical protein DMD81_01885 [Candidatus Rokubacteria bacterium]
MDTTPSSSKSVVGLATSSSAPSIEVVEREPDFAALREEWEELCTLAGARVYQSFDWQWLWWKHFGHGLALHVVVFRQHGTLIGIAPFCLDTESPFSLGTRRSLRLLGSPARIRESSGLSMTYDPSDYLDVVVRPEFASAIGRACAEHLRDQRALYDSIELVNVPEDSTVMKEIVPCLHRAGFTVQTRPTDACPRLRVPASVQEYVRARRSGVRRRLSQAHKASLRGGSFAIETVDGEEPIREALQALVRLHQRRWNRLGYPGLFFERRFERFVADVTERLAHRGRLWLKTARADGQLIAVRLGFVFNRTVYDYLSGFDCDPVVSRRRPGLALLLSMIEDATRLGARHVDLLRGDEDYKYDLTSDVARNWTVTARIAQTRVADVFQTGLGLLELAGTRWWRERLIMRVHSEQYGMPRGMARYLRFRSTALARKIRRTRRDVPPETGSTAMTRPEEAPAEWSRNLLHSFAELRDHLRDLSVARTDGRDGRTLALDGYLTVCALWQIVEDFLHRGFFGVEKEVRKAGREKSSADRPANASASGWTAHAEKALGSSAVMLLARAADTLAAGLVDSRVLLRESGLLRTSAILRRTVVEVASLLADAAGLPDVQAMAERLQTSVRPLLGASYPQKLSRRIMKIPQCFRDFDVHPDDCRELVRKFTETVDGRNEPVTVLGLRTSGCYLAPLYAAHLVAQGFADVLVESVRPGVNLLASERRRLRGRLRRGMVLIVDDPPFTGDALRACVDMVERMGVPGRRITVLVLEEPDAPLFRYRADHGSAWADLESRARMIVLPRHEWRIRRVFAALGNGTNATNGTKVELLGDEVTGDLRTPAPASARWRRARRHDRARITIRHATPRGIQEQAFVAKGAGIGWFQDHACTIARHLEGFTPPASWLKEGLVLLPWIDGTALVDRPQACDESFVRHAARYVAERSRALPIEGDFQLDLEDRKTGWHLLARTFGRSYGILRSFSHYGLRRELSAICEGAPRAVIDGRMGPAEWIVSAGGGDPIKVDFEEHAFDRSDRLMFDPVLDLAGIAVEHRLPAHLERLLMSEYVDRSGDNRAPDRLPACKMMVSLSRIAELSSQAFDAGLDCREVAIDVLERERMLASIANGFLASAYRVPGVQRDSDQFVAIDVDGVLEDSTLGFNAMTPAAARALRMLGAHGFQPILASGRSLLELVDRCRALGLRAAIAEYGSVVWEEGREKPAVLAKASEWDQLVTLRRLLRDQDDVVVDPAYEYSVRVYRLVKDSRRPVPVAWLAELLCRHHLDELRIVQGDGQTDVVGESCNKGNGLQFLKTRLDVRSVAAVGDTIEDLALFRAADQAFAPSNAHARLVAAAGSSGLQVVKGRVQRGLLEVATTLAHGQGRSCAQGCDDPESWSRGVAILVRALGLRDRGRLRKLCDLVGRDAFKALGVSR